LSSAHVVSGPDIVKAILALDVDLMWFGGIGTYVKATTESHGEVGDKVNDNVRVNASDLRAKVIGEGANLAITQRARTEYALRGGRCNTDAIDNSAGVDCSDHEVNLKILLAPLSTTGRLARDARDKLLRELEPDVAHFCVQDNYLQSALLSMEALRTRKHGDAFLDVVAYLDKHGLDRAAQQVPGDEELKTWLATGKGLPRNLLAVLVAHTKLDLCDRVLQSRLPDLPLVEPFLISYFPPKIVEQFRAQVKSHHLRREIIATVVTNALINQAGTTLLVQLQKETTLPIDQLAERYFMCDELLGGRALRAAIHAADYKVAAQDQYDALLALEDVLRHLLRWWLWNEPGWKLGPDDVARAKAEVEAATTALVGALDGPAKLAYEVREHELGGKHFAPATATALARVPLARDVFALIAAAREAKLPVADAAHLWFRAGKQLHVDSFEEQLAAQVPANVWERRFLAALERDAAATRQRAVCKLAADPDFVARHAEPIARLADALKMVRQSGTHGLVPLFLILEDYRALWVQAELAKPAA
jgi:glutamate dehydrogenase